MTAVNGSVLFARYASDVDLELAEEANAKQAFITFLDVDGMPLTIALGPAAFARLQEAFSEHMLCEVCDDNIATTKDDVDRRVCTSCLPRYDDEPRRGEL